MTVRHAPPQRIAQLLKRGCWTLTGCLQRLSGALAPLNKRMQCSGERGLNPQPLHWQRNTLPNRDKGLAGAGRGCAQVASCAQRLLEHSLLTELQGVVARTLQGVDMFSQTQLAGMLGHPPRLPHAQPQCSEGQTQVLLMYIAVPLARQLWSNFVHVPC